MAYLYDVALSFAGKDRPYVAKVAGLLKAAGVTVFYDDAEAVTLWGKDLYEHLSDVYQNQARYTVMFVSDAYAERIWTNHERKAAQARALKEKGEYILPARFDATPIPGLMPTIGYIELRNLDAEDFARLILRKLEREVPSLDQPDRDNIVSLPGEQVGARETIRERASRLAERARKEETRVSLLSSGRGVEIAREQVAELFGYIKSEASAISDGDHSLGLTCVAAKGVLLVRTSRASFTMYWGEQYSNSLRHASLFCVEYNGPHSLGSNSGSRYSVRESHTQFDVDDALVPGWREEDNPKIVYTTRQLADKYLGRVLDRAYSVIDADPADEE